MLNHLKEYICFYNIWMEEFNRMKIFLSVRVYQSIFKKLLALKHAVLHEYC